MKITQSKAKDLVSQINIEIIENDYKQKVDDILQDYRKKAVIPGFRKGKTPLSIINKKYGNSVLVEEVNKILQDEMYKYIKSNNLRVLGSPIPLEDIEVDWEKSTDFIFKYEVGLAPEFSINITPKDKLDYYKIKVDPKLIKSYCDDIAKRHGTMEEVEVSTEGDLLFCSINQLDSQNNIIEKGVSNEATVSIDIISDKKIKKQFTKLKKKSSLDVNVMDAFQNHTDLAAMLNISVKDLKALDSTLFRFTIKTISRMRPAEINNELFDKVYGPGKVANIKEFKDKIKKEAEGQFNVESDRMLKNDVVKYFIDKLNLKLPDEFLKRWLLKTSEQPITMELLNKEYDMYSKSLQWQLIENKIIEKYDIQVKDEDVLTHTKQLVAAQMKQYGQNNTDDKQLIDISSNILKNEKERKKIYDQIFDERTIKLYKQNFKLKEKSISYDDFVKLASEK